MMQSMRTVAMGRVKPSAGSRTARPFTASKQAVRPAVSVRAASVDAPQQEEAELTPLVFDDEEEQEERVVLTDDARAAVRVADELMSSFTLETVVEACLDSPTPSATAKALQLVEDKLEAAKGSLGGQLDIAAAITASGMDIIEVGEIEDYQGGEAFRKYDEEEQAAIPDEVKQSIQGLKLTRQELANLLPEDWDTVTVNWFSDKKEENIPLPEYKLTFMWQRDNLSVAVDQVYSRGQVSPLTEYFVWPRKDAWEELKASLEARPSVSERDRVFLLNRLTEVINFWQSDEKPTIDQARGAFPDCSFA